MKTRTVVEAAKYSTHRLAKCINKSSATSVRDLKGRPTDGIILPGSMK